MQTKLQLPAPMFPATKSLNRAWFLANTKVIKKLSSILISVKKNVRRKIMMVS